MFKFLIIVLVLMGTFGAQKNGWALHHLMCGWKEYWQKVRADKCSYCNGCKTAVYSIYSYRETGMSVSFTILSFLTFWCKMILWFWKMDVNTWTALFDVPKCHQIKRPSPESQCTSLRNSWFPNINWMLGQDNLLKVNDFERSFLLINSECFSSSFACFCPPCHYWVHEMVPATHSGHTYTHCKVGCVSQHSLKSLEEILGDGTWP